MSPRVAKIFCKSCIFLGEKKKISTISVFYTKDGLTPSYKYDNLKKTKYIYIYILKHMKIFNRESSISYIILSFYKNEKIKRKENSIKKLYHYVDAHFGSPVGGRSPTIWAEKS